MLKNIVKRDGRIALYDESKIAGAILKAMAASSEGNPADAPRIAEEVGSPTGFRRWRRFRMRWKSP